MHPHTLRAATIWAVLFSLDLIKKHDGKDQDTVKPSHQAFIIWSVRDELEGSGKHMPLTLSLYDELMITGFMHGAFPNRLVQGTHI